jgi:hypothetical protein
LQHLVFFDYLTLHSSDVGGPDSLHADYHAIRRVDGSTKVIGTRFVSDVAPGLAEMIPTPEGVFVSCFRSCSGILAVAKFSVFMKKLRERAKWVADTYGEATFDELLALEKKFL